MPEPEDEDRLGRAVLDDLLTASSKLQVYLDRNTEMSPIGRVGEAIDQAHLIHFLASDASKFATGATFRANGGVGLVW